MRGPVRLLAVAGLLLSCTSAQARTDRRPASPAVRCSRRTTRGAPTSPVSRSAHTPRPGSAASAAAPICTPTSDPIRATASRTRSCLPPSRGCRSGSPIMRTRATPAHIRFRRTRASKPAATRTCSSRPRTATCTRCTALTAPARGWARRPARCSTCGRTRCGTKDGRRPTPPAADPARPGPAGRDAAGHIDHALRFTVSHTQRGYIHPATHQAGERPRRRAADGRPVPAEGVVPPARILRPGAGDPALPQEVRDVVADNGGGLVHLRRAVALLGRRRPQPAQDRPRPRLRSSLRPARSRDAS